MALGLSTGGSGGADRIPYVKYDARAGRMFRIDRAEVNGQWQSNQVDITGVAEFVADLANISVGWINYTDQGPVKMMVPLGQPLPARPEGTNAQGKAAFKQGFDLIVALAKAAGGGAREFNSNAGCVIEAMDELHNAYLGAAEAKAGKLPVVKITTTIPVKSGQSTNYKPVFSVTGWVDRPGVLNTTTQAEETSIAPSTGSTQVAPPAAKQAPQPAGAADIRDFG